VFLEQNYSLEKLQKLRNDDSSERESTNAEFWMNLINVDSFFEHSNAPNEHVEVFTKKLVETWSAKLKIDFPNIKFAVEYMHDSDTNDYALTFYKMKPQ
jgi:hypothetical protein